MAKPFVFTPNWTGRLWKGTYNSLSQRPLVADVENLPVRWLKPWLSVGNNVTFSTQFLNRFHVAPVLNFADSLGINTDTLGWSLWLAGCPERRYFQLNYGGPIAIAGIVECYYLFGRWANWA